MGCQEKNKSKYRNQSTPFPGKRPWRSKCCKECECFYTDIQICGFRRDKTIRWLLRQNIRYCWNPASTRSDPAHQDQLDYLQQSSPSNHSPLQGRSVFLVGGDSHRRLLRFTPFFGDRSRLLHTHFEKLIGPVQACRYRCAVLSGAMGRSPK